MIWCSYVSIFLSVSMGIEVPDIILSILPDFILVHVCLLLLKNFILAASFTTIEENYNDVTDSVNSETLRTMIVTVNNEYKFQKESRFLQVVYGTMAIIVMMILYHCKLYFTSFFIMINLLLRVYVRFIIIKLHTMNKEFLSHLTDDK